MLVLDLDETLVHFKPGDSKNINFRPHLQTFLSEMAQHYEIVIFTSAVKEYADLVINFIDAERRFVSRRYYRDDIATEQDGQRVKDLTLVSKNLAKTIIIDNMPENFVKQSKNGIFIKSWYDDPHDTALLELMPLLKEIVVSNVADVRMYLEDQRRRLIENIKRGCLNPKPYF